MFVTVDLSFTGIRYSHCVDDLYSRHFQKNTNIFICYSCRVLNFETHKGLL